MSAPPDTALVWKFAGLPKKRHGDWSVCPCEACNDVTLNVWERVGVKRIRLWRCWTHGPGQDGRPCDGPKQTKG